MTELRTDCQATAVALPAGCSLQLEVRELPWLGGVCRSEALDVKPLTFSVTGTSGLEGVTTTGSQLNSGSSLANLSQRWTPPPPDGGQ